MTYTVKEVPPVPRIKWVCSHCGSDNVFARWMCVWDVKKQEWIPEDWDEPDYCHDCENDCLEEKRCILKNAKVRPEQVQQVVQYVALIRASCLAATH